MEPKFKVGETVVMGMAANFGGVNVTINIITSQVIAVHEESEVYYDIFIPGSSENLYAVPEYLLATYDELKGTCLFVSPPAHSDASGNAQCSDFDIKSEMAKIAAENLDD